VTSLTRVRGVMTMENAIIIIIIIIMKVEYSIFPYYIYKAAEKHNVPTARKGKETEKTAITDRPTDTLH
jgi:hypothetical protein